ncbi:IRON TRANSPORTER FTH1 [Ceraceosorus bombacis]|uniref:IRON TRANSPORTER FTH1 n=1 Tax=Ceraceosorus bombacis TaxID=401625 RepID=A0A0P1BMB3_9BASI|nr:IRON TRANSPORTER FTH1 [Ceraceosorus bombacis]
MSSPTGNKVFAPAIFFIAFRESLEAALVIGILSGLLETLVNTGRVQSKVKANDKSSDGEESDAANATGRSQDESKALVTKLRWIVILGALSGLFIAFCIGAAFLAVFYTQANDLYGKAEELWEGIFNLIAVLLITPMSLAILRADRSRAKWRRKLRNAFADVRADKHGAGSQSSPRAGSEEESEGKSPASEAEKNLEQPQEISTLPQVSGQSVDDSQHRSKGFATKFKSALQPLRQGKKGALALFFIPLVTTLREGLEGVVFIGGVSLGLPATSIPLPAVVGIAAGLLVGAIVFRAGSVGKQVRFFLILSTVALLIIAAGMASRAVYYLQFYRYVKLVGDAAAESGSGPGSYYYKDYVWHLDCCNPEDTTSSGGWGILNSLVGWNNTATIGSVLAYVFYWLAITAYLGYAAWKEGRLAKVVRKFRGVKPSSNANASVSA